MSHSSQSSESISVSVAPTTSPSPDATRPSKRDVYQKYGCFSLIAFFSHRVLRSGPRIFLYLGAILASLFIITKSLPFSLQETIVTHTSKYWSPHPADGVYLPPDNEHDAHVGGGLRIVVFGENDVATSNLRPIPGVELGYNNGTAWTDVLCSELLCTTYLSYVPMLNWPPLSHTSNSLFTETTETVLADSKGKTPALDYSFLTAKYPLHTKVADLAGQIKAFLSQPKPDRPPRETVFVFSFGTWDVWTLSSYPYVAADTLITSLVDDMFTQIEELFNASHDPESVAYSNNTIIPLVEPEAANATAGEGEEADSSHAHQRRDGSIISRPPTPILPWDHEVSQPFRIVIPTLLDPSILPIWHLDRPDSPELHTKPEQMRSAVRLTTSWNRHVEYHMEQWIKKNKADPNANKDSDAKPAPVNISNKKRLHESENPDAGPIDANEDTPEVAQPNKTVVVEPPVWREATLFRMTDYILDIMIDSQMKIEKRKDKKGFGTLDKKETFVEVRRPCVDDSTSSPPPPEKRDLLSRNSAAICDSPDEHFFFTPYSLGRRGIENIGRFAAGLLQASPSEKEEYDKTVNILENMRRPWTWKAFFSP